MCLMRLGVFLCLAISLAAQTVNYTYDAAGRLTTVAYPNGATITYTYDPAGNLLSRQVTSSANSSPSANKKVKTKKARKEAPKPAE